MVWEVTGQRSEDRDQRSEIRGQRSEIRGQRSEDRGQGRAEKRSGCLKAQGAALWKPGAEDAEGDRSPRNGAPPAQHPSRAESPRWEPGAPGPAERMGVRGLKVEVGCACWVTAEVQGARRRDASSEGPKVRECKVQNENRGSEICGLHSERPLRPPIMALMRSDFFSGFQGAALRTPGVNFVVTSST